jgi:hypothetical protein
MTRTRDLNGSIERQKRRYKSVVEDMKAVIQAESQRLGESNFDPSHTVDSTAFRLIQEINALRALLEVEETENQKDMKQTI